MKRFMDNNKGAIWLTAIVVIAGVMLGLAVFGLFHRAEAIIGEPGNLVNATDHTPNVDHPHNLAAGSSGIQASTEKRVCIFCHASHNTRTDADLINAPLWNHTLSSATYTVLSSNTLVNSVDKYSLYNAGIVNMLSSPPTSPDGASRLCLSCHDGTVAIGSVGSEAVAIAMDTSHNCLTADGKLTNTVDPVNCKTYIGTDLTKKHVISIPINDALKAASASNCYVAGQTFRVKYPWDAPDAQTNVVILRPTTQQYSGSYGTDASASGSTKYNTGYYYGVQCSTCHDAHYWSPTAGVGNKLVVTNDFDSLCKACHEPCP